MDSGLGVGRIWLGVVVTLLGQCSAQMAERPTCTTDVALTAEGCELNIQTMSNILKDYYGGQRDRATFCRNDFERCVSAIETASYRRCPRIDAAEQTYHARVNALRGFCADIEAWQNYKGCITAQINGQLMPCEQNYYRAKQNFTQTEFKDGQYASEFERRNARCRVQRDYQQCTENVIYANCRYYYDYFRDYQVALLTPYCRQLYQLRSRYSVDDPNTAGRSGTGSVWLACYASMAALLVKRTFQL